MAPASFNPMNERTNKIMSKSIQTVKLSKTKIDEINGLAQYIRSDMAKAMAAIRRSDEATFRECTGNVLTCVYTWRSEVSEYMKKADMKKNGE